MEEVQWYSGHSGGGVRSAMLYGVTKVHLRMPDDSRTLCGRAVPFPFASRKLFPSEGDERCKPCAAKWGLG